LTRGGVIMRWGTLCQPLDNRGGFLSGK